MPNFRKEFSRREKHGQVKDQSCSQPGMRQDCALRGSGMEFDVSLSGFPPLSEVGRAWIPTCPLHCLT